MMCRTAALFESFLFTLIFFLLLFFFFFFSFVCFCSSGEFHTYRAHRRREMHRVAAIDEEIQNDEAVAKLQAATDKVSYNVFTKPSREVGARGKLFWSTARGCPSGLRIRFSIRNCKTGFIL